MASNQPLMPIHTALWSETADSGNPYRAGTCHLRGYDVFGELIHQADYLDCLHVQLLGEKPSASQERMLNTLAIALANPGARDPAMQAAAAGAVGGSTAAACLIAALGVGSGAYGGAHEVRLLVQALHTMDADKRTPLSLLAIIDRLADDISLWPERGFRPGFDPYAETHPLPVDQLLSRLDAVAASPRSYSPWLKQNIAEIEQAAGAAIDLMLVVAAGLADLGCNAQQAEMLTLLLRLPGAAAHALEKHMDFKRYPMGRIVDHTLPGVGADNPGNRDKTDLLDYHHGVVHSHAGSFDAERNLATVRGGNLHTELEGLSYLQIYLFELTGRLDFSRAELALLDAILRCTAYPDARIYPNRIAALGATTRATGNTAVMAAGCVQEALIYGRGAAFYTMEFMQRAMTRQQGGESLAAIIEQERRNRKYIKGFGRPLAGALADERIPYLQREMAALKLPVGRYQQQAYDIEDHLMRSSAGKIRMTYGGFWPALMLDMDFDRDHAMALMYSFCFQPGYAAVYLDTLQQPPGTAFVATCSDIVYEGPAARPWP